MKSIGNCFDTSINICLFQGYCIHLPRKWITYSVHWITELGQRFTRYYATTRMLDSQVCYFFYQEGWGWGSDCEPKMLQFYFSRGEKVISQNVLYVLNFCRLYVVHDNQFASKLLNVSQTLYLIFPCIPSIFAAMCDFSNTNGIKYDISWMIISVTGWRKRVFIIQILMSSLNYGLLKIPS